MRDLRPTNCTLTVALGTYHFFSSYILQRSPGRQINTAFLQEKGEKIMCLRMILILFKQEEKENFDFLVEKIGRRVQGNFFGNSTGKGCISIIFIYPFSKGVLRLIVDLFVALIVLALEVLVFDGGLLVLLVFGHEVVHVRLGLRELHLVHAFTSVPMQESLKLQIFKHENINRNIFLDKQSQDRNNAINKIMNQ